MKPQWSMQFTSLRSIFSHERAIQPTRKWIDLSDSEQVFCFKTLKANMLSFYRDSSWGWKPKKKKTEMRDDRMLYIVAHVGKNYIFTDYFADSGSDSGKHWIHLVYVRQRRWADGFNCPHSPKILGRILLWIANSCFLSRAGTWLSACGGLLIILKGV